MNNNLLNNAGKFLIFAGILAIFIGILLVISSRFKIPFLGKLPGDILIRKENFTFYFPLATSLIISAILSLILFFLNRR